MERLTDEFINSKLDPTPIDPSREELFLAFLVCKNLSDLCETGRAINNELESAGKLVPNLPQNDDIKTIEGVIRRYYRDDMFTHTEESDHLPNWPVIKGYDRLRCLIAVKIYRSFKHNTIASPNSGEICDAIRKQDRKYFVEKFDQIFANMPSKEHLVKFKNFVTCSDIPESSQNRIWEFFQCLLDLISSE